MQVADDAFPNVYACGDVAETGTPNPNARSAMRQGLVAACNVLSAIQGETPSLEFVPHFAEGFIKLTVSALPSWLYFFTLAILEFRNFGMMFYEALFCFLAVRTSPPRPPNIPPGTSSLH